MLCLSRKVGESVLIDGGIRVTVLKVNGKRVRLGIEAPDHVNVTRQEIEVEVEETQPAADAA